MANINQMVQAIQQQQELVIAENKRLNQILSIQKALIEKQRKYLIDVATTAKELLETEKQRMELKSKLASQKTALLVAASEAQETTALVGEVLQQDSGSPEIGATESGRIAAKVVDAVAAQVTQLTDECLGSDVLSVPPAAIQETISAINQLLQKVIDAGLATESPEDTIRRQSYAISSLVSSTEEE